MAWRPPVIIMSMLRGCVMRTGRLRTEAASAAPAAVGRWRVSLPPKPPPVRRLVARMWLRGTPSTLEILLCLMFGSIWFGLKAARRPDEADRQWCGVVGGSGDGGGCGGDGGGGGDGNGGGGSRGWWRLLVVVEGGGGEGFRGT